MSRGCSGYNRRVFFLFQPMFTGVLCVFSTCVLRCFRVVYFLLDSGLQAFNLLVIVGPLGHDPHRGVQLGLFGHGVVALKSGTLSRVTAWFGNLSTGDENMLHLV